MLDVKILGHYLEKKKNQSYCVTLRVSWNVRVQPCVLLDFFFSFSNIVLHCLYIVTCAKSGVMLSNLSYNLIKVIKIITTNAYNIKATVSQKKCMM